MKPFRTLGAIVAVSLALAGCAQSDASVRPTEGKAVQTLDLPGLPADLLGLSIKKEDVGADVAKVPSTFIDGLALYSLRHNDLVQATFQVSRFNRGAHVESAKFRQTVVNQIGSSAPREFRLAGRAVYLTTGTKQSIAVWFKGRYLFILASRADYDEPRTLLRKALEIEP